MTGRGHAGLGTVGLLGGGVIGGGWAARFLLNGVDVQMYDPDAEAPRKVGEVLDNARRALGRLTFAPLPPEGRLTFVDTPMDAATGADFVQESAPERMELKRSLLQAASRAAGPEVVFGSSTSGLLPTELQRDMVHPQRLVVGHPFNPVYLLPLVEVVPGAATAELACIRAAEVYRSLGMEPLLLRKEVDGFVADRLLEALWREALWLVADDVATVEEIDDAIRFGAGLRWSMMGTFLTYRIAGGEAGMRHFMAQFGPALKWPWSKLTDVPELDDALLDRLVEQSDMQARGRSVRELERLRDDCLVAVMQGLRTQRYGAGAVLDDYERTLFERAPHPALPDPSAGPLRLHEVTVPADWADYNGHMHESRYLQVLGDACDALYRAVGIDARYLKACGSYYTVETHLRFLAEVAPNERLVVATQVLGLDEKRLHLWNELRRASDDEVVATGEQMCVHVDATTKRSAPAGTEVLAALRAIADAHAALPAPDGAGRRVSMPGRP